MSRDANSLPGNPRIKSDPGTQKEIARRSPKFGATGAVIHTPGGVFYEPNRAAALIAIPLPFQISGNGPSITAAAGSLAASSIAKTTEANPANGSWFYQAIIGINTATGDITSRATEWTQTPGTPTASTYYFTIGGVEVSGGKYQSGTAYNAAYGPIIALTVGSSAYQWAVIMI